MIRLFLLVMAVVMVAACQPAAPDDGELPTLAVLPSITPTDEPTLTPTETLTPQPTSTSTERPTQTPRPTATPTATPSHTPINPTEAAISTGTAAVQEAPRLSTFTPAPGGIVPEGTPQQLADVVITQRQFQEEVNLHLGDAPSIQAALVNFVPGGISVSLTALGGEAYITGDVFVSIVLTGSFATISIGEITVNAPEPPERYIEVINTEFLPLMITALDTILKQRLGDDQDLANIVVSEDVMEVTLLVPR